jgi:hypothetical protein
VLSALRGGSGADAGPGSGSTTSPSGSPQPTGAKLEVKAVTSFDPPPAGNGDENGYAATRVTDGNRATVWTTKSYKDPFGPGGLKDGVGLVLDLGSSQQIGSVTVWVTGGATDLELRASDQQGSSLSDFTAVTSTARDVDGRAVFVPKDPLKARYLLVWLTKLPNDGSGYRGQVSEITVRG